MYIVNGPVPECRADQVLRLMPAIQIRPPQLIGGGESSGRRRGLASVSGSGAAAGVAPRPSAQRQESEDSEDAELRAAMAMSLQGQGAGTSK